MSEKDDRGNVLGISDYDTLNAKTVAKAIRHLEFDQLAAVLRYEKRRKNRKTVSNAIYRRVKNNSKALKDTLQREAEKGFTILVAGRTGVGKSATISSLFGWEVAETNEFISETKEVTPYEGTYNKINYTIYDTPGLGEWNNYKEDLDEQYLSLVRERCPSPDILWYVCKLDDSRVTREDARGLELIRQSFGDTIWDRTMIVFTHADKVPDKDVDKASVPKEFQRIFEGRTSSVNDVIVEVTAGKSQGLPAVAVDNTQKHTPDGAEWLGELFTTSFERLDPERLTPLLAAFAEDLEIPKTQDAKTDVSEENTQEPEKRIPLTQEQVVRVEHKVTDSPGLLSSIAEGVSVGFTIDVATGGTTGGLGAVLGGIVGFISWCKRK